MVEIITRMQNYGYVDLIKQLTYIAEELAKLSKHRDLSEQTNLNEWMIKGVK